jgi:hypothetical protein
MLEWFQDSFEADKEVIAASCWNGRFYFLKERELPLMWNGTGVDHK